LIAPPERIVPITPPPAGIDAAQPKAAQDERITVLTELVKAVAAEFQSGAANIAQVAAAENELCNALLDSTDEPEKRVALLTKQLDKMNRLVEVTQGQVKAGIAGQADLLRAKSLCLSIKIKLLRELSGRKPPTKTVQGGNEEYTIVRTTEAKETESKLNDLARQGWKVRTFSGPFIILAR